MAKPHLITGLDIGTGSVKLLTAFKKSGEGEFEVLGMEQEVASGMRRGVVVDPHRVSNIISLLTQKVGQDAGYQIQSTYVSVGGVHLFSTSSRGLISVSRADQKISQEDIDRVLQGAQTLHLPSNKEILEVVPKEFIVDGEGGVKDAVGMQGVRLEAEVLIVGGFTPYLKNSTQAILGADLQINGLVPVPMSAARAVLTPREKELGVAVLEIGAGISSLGVYEEGVLVHLAVFPIGSGNITSDIAICLKTDIDTAEKVKIEFGGCNLSPAQRRHAAKEEKKIKIEGEEAIAISRKTLCDIIEARACEILNLVNKELKKIGRQALLPAGVVLTGGGAKLPGIRELAKKELKLPVRIGTPQGFPSLPEDPSFATLCGLVWEGADLEEENGQSGSFGKGMQTRLRKLLRIFVP